MKNLIKSIFVLLLLVFANCMHAQNACEFDTRFSFGFKASEKSSNLIETKSNMFLLTGTSGYKTNMYDSRPDTPFFVIKKIDACNNQLWSKNPLGFQKSNPLDILEDNNGDILNVISIEGIRNLVKLDSNGNLKWKVEVKNSPNYFAAKLIKLNANKYLLADRGFKGGSVLIFDTLGNTIAKRYIDSLNSLSTIYNVYYTPNKNIILTGLKDSSIALITTIDTLTNTLTSIEIPLLIKENIFTIDLNNEHSEILVNGSVTLDNNPYLASYDMQGKLIRDTTLMSDLFKNSGCINFTKNENIFFISNSWILTDSSYQIKKIEKSKLTLNGYSSPLGLSSIIKSSNNFFIGIGYYSEGSVSVKTNIPYIKSIVSNKIITSIYIISGSNTINTQGGLLQLTAAILPGNATNRQVIWSISDTNLATITQIGLVTAKANGTVIVTATAADGGGATATKTITITNQTVGINEVNLNNQITVYPNPASNKLIIKTTNNLTPDASGLQLQLLDLTGKVIANYNNQTEIDISAIANGMYLLHIQTPNGNLVKQVVVNR